MCVLAPFSLGDNTFKVEIKGDNYPGVLTDEDSGIPAVVMRLGACYWVLLPPYFIHPHYRMFFLGV